MPRRRVIFWGLFAVWLACFAASFVIPAMTPPTGDGFTRGLNRLTEFFKYQVLATLAGLILLLVVRGQPWRSLYGLLGRVPAIIAGLFVAALAITILYSRMQG